MRVYHYAIMLYHRDSTDLQTVFRTKMQALHYIEGTRNHYILRVRDGAEPVPIAWTDSEGRYHYQGGTS